MGEFGTKEPKLPYDERKRLAEIFREWFPALMPGVSELTTPPSVFLGGESDHDYDGALVTIKYQEYEHGLFTADLTKMRLFAEDDFWILFWRHHHIDNVEACLSNGLFQVKDPVNQEEIDETRLREIVPEPSLEMELALLEHKMEADRRRDLNGIDVGDLEFILDGIGEHNHIPREN